MFSWLHECWWSSRFTIFSSFSLTNPFYFPFSRWWTCRLWQCHVLQVPTAQQHAAARRDEEKMHSAAACTCCNQATFRSTSLVPWRAEGRQGELLLCSQHTWTAMVSRKWSFTAVKMAIPLAFGYLRVQTDALQSWYEFSSSQTRLWSVTDTCRSRCMDKRTSGTMWSTSWKKIHQAAAWQKYMKHRIAIPIKHSQTSSQL